MLYISARDHARKLNFSSYVHLPSINKKFQYRYAWVILCSVGDVNIFEHSAIFHFKTFMILILRSYVLLECINAVYKYGHA